MLAFKWALIEHQKMKTLSYGQFCKFWANFRPPVTFWARDSPKIDETKKNRIIYPRTQYLQKNLSSIGFEDSP